MANAPSTLVGHAGLPLDFLGRYPVPSAGHEVHRKEPDRELGARFVENGPGARVDVMAAFLTGVGPALAHRVEHGPLVADRAVGFLAAVLDFHDPLEASCVVRELSLELLESILGHGAIPCYLRLRDNLSEVSLAVKG